MRYDPERIKRLKEQYPPGTRIELTSMTDPYSPVPAGTLGSVDHIDDGGTYAKQPDMISYHLNSS